MTYSLASFSFFSRAVRTDQFSFDAFLSDTVTIPLFALSVKNNYFNVNIFKNITLTDDFSGSIGFNNPFITNE